MDYFKKKLFFLGLLAIAFAPCANATLVLSNGGPNQNNGNEMTDFLQSDDFTLASSTSLNGVTFWNLQLSPTDYLGSIFWAIQSDAGGTPGAVVAAGTTSNVIRQATGLTDKSGTFSEFENTFEFPLMNLLAGTYWLTLHDGPVAASNFADFYWEWSNDSGNGQEFDLIANNGWDSNFAEHAFSLNVPEPNSTSLLLSGLLIAGFWMRRSSLARTRV